MNGTPVIEMVYVRINLVKQNDIVLGVYDESMIDESGYYAINCFHSLIVGKDILVPEQ